METTLSNSANRVQSYLASKGYDFTVKELAASTRSANDAASAIGCEVGQIVKSLVFKCAGSEQPLLVLTSGSNRVDEKKVASLVGVPITKADADFVRAHTGYAIGGVPPVAHETQLRTLVENSLMQYGTIWAAAGTPNAVFALTPEALVELTAALRCDISCDTSKS